MKYPRYSATLIVKGTYDLRPGKRAVPSQEQPELSGDIFAGDEATGAVQYPSDFGYFKPRSDVLIVGRFHASGGKPVETGTAAIEVGTIRKRVAIFGNRFWQRSAVGLVPTRPQPVVEVPITYENSYGGIGHPENPVGKGTAPVVQPDGTRAWPLPNVENPHDLVTSHESAPSPAGFAPLNLMWPQRLSKAGTYDDKWKKERWPWLPEDLDWTFFNAAPLDQQCEGFLVGNETIRLENLHPEYPVYETSLPDLRIRCFYSPVVGAPLYFQEVPMNLDTLLIDAEAEKVVLLWRGFVYLRGDTLGNDDRVFVAAEQQQDEPRSLEHYEGLCAQRVHEQETEVEPESPLGVEVSGDESDSGEADEEAAITAEDEDRFAEAARQTLEELDGPVQGSKAWCLARYEKGDSFEGLDLTGADLCGESLEGANFTNAVLAEAFLRDAKLQGANFSGAVLSDADLTGADLTGAVFTGADLTSARLSRCRLEGAILSTADLSGARLQFAQLSGVVAINALLANADLYEANLSGADLTGADLSGSALHLVNLTHATLKDASIENASGFPVDAAEADLTGLRAAGAVLWESDFRGVRAPGSIWEGAELRDSDFRGADLTRAEFEAASLPGADLTCAVLRHARLVGTDLRSARLVNCDLLGASLEKADLTGALVTDANLFTVEILETELTDARLDRSNLKRTILDDR